MAIDSGAIQCPGKNFRSENQAIPEISGNDTSGELQVYFYPSKLLMSPRF